jgi:hypothetical protein
MGVLSVDIAGSVGLEPVVAMVLKYTVRALNE